MTVAGSPWSSIETPALLVDLDLMEANIRRWQTVFDDAGVAFRPHIKTHKSLAIANCQLAAGAVGLAVAKVAEAEVFAAAGCRDLAVTYPVVGPTKWRRLAELARACTITVNVESEIGRPRAQRGRGCRRKRAPGPSGHRYRGTSERRSAR